MLKNEEYSWRFPPTHGGAEHGSNAAQHHFAADAYAKMVRETLQNSLDHPETGLAQVKVTFQIMDIPAEAINAAQLVPHILAAAQEVNEAEEKENFEKAAAMLQRPTVKTLAITDSNTTGLIGANWENLILREGAPEIGSDIAKGGSFGFGKNAPFNMSVCRTVIYSTRYVSIMAKGRVTQAAGRCQLRSHSDPQTSERLQHIGFLAVHDEDNKNYNDPIQGPEIPQVFQLAETGTGIFITGFDNQAFFDWPNRTRDTTIKNFFAAIQHGNLTVEIKAEDPNNCFKIDQSSIGTLIADLPPKDETRHYYQAIKNEGKSTAPSGKLTQFGNLHLWITTEPDSCRRLAHINRRGMLITESRQPSENPLYPYGGGSWAPWAAVTIATSEDADRYLRKMEPPAHDSIKPALLKSPNDEATARDELRNQQDQIRNRIRDEIDSLHKDQSENIRELADLFPGMPIQGEQIDTSVRPINRNDSQALRPEQEVQQVDDPDNDEDEEQNRKNNSNEGNNGENDKERTNEGERQQRQQQQRSEEQQSGSRRALRGLRIIKQNPTTLFMTFKTPPNEEETVNFDLRVAGEQYMSSEERISIREVTEMADLTIQCSHQNGTIQVSAPADTTVNLRIETEEPDHRHVSYRVAPPEKRDSQT